MAYSWYEDATNEPKKKDKQTLIVREGDTITVDFTEWILTTDSTSELKYRVFQTTDPKIASDDSIAKSVTLRKILLNNTGDPVNREKLTAIVGNDLSNEMNVGFNNIVIDMKEGETITGVEITPLDGYGEKNPALIQVINYTDNIPIYNSIDRFAFEAEYANELTLKPGQTFEDHYWGWMIRIESLTNDTVVIKHEPMIGTEVAFSLWNATVINISSENGMIWLQHKPVQK
jgi:hypothetical protein